jgi:hypothetical protein
MLQPSTVLDWYLGFLHHMLHVDLGMPIWDDIRLTERVEYGIDGLPTEVGPLFSVDD